MPFYENLWAGGKKNTKMKSPISRAALPSSKQGGDGGNQLMNILTTKRGSGCEAEMCGSGARGGLVSASHAQMLPCPVALLVHLAKHQ